MENTPKTDTTSKRPRKPIEIIKDKLYWLSKRDEPTGYKNTIFFNIDNDLEYWPFFKDFGPLNLSMTVKFVRELKKILDAPSLKDKRIIHHTSRNSDKKANAAYLMGAFQVLVLGRTAEQAFYPFRKTKIKPFRDALHIPCSYECTILHCLQGLEFAKKAGWLDLDSFDTADYDHYQEIEHGDMNWIVPGKFLAFCTPVDDCPDNRYLSPKTYSKVFKKKNISTVVRLNQPRYDPKGFTREGIDFKDIYFVDGTTPSNDQV